MLRAVVVPRLIVALVVMLAPSIRVCAQDGTLPDGVRALLGATKAITVFDHVTASASRGVVTIRGKVTSRAKRDQLETELATAPGVTQIVNRLEVLRAVPADDGLRHRIARAIYGHPSFRAYAAMSQPPIRVLVEGGRVTLAGEVRTSVERLVARSLAEAESRGAVSDQLVVVSGGG